MKTLPLSRKMPLFSPSAAPSAKIPPPKSLEDPAAGTRLYFFRNMRFMSALPEMPSTRPEEVYCQTAKL